MFKLALQREKGISGKDINMYIGTEKARDLKFSKYKELSW